MTLFFCSRVSKSCGFDLVRYPILFPHRMLACSLVSNIPLTWPIFNFFVFLRKKLYSRLKQNLCMRVPWSAIFRWHGQFSIFFVFLRKNLYSRKKKFCIHALHKQTPVRFVPNVPQLSQSLRFSFYFDVFFWSFFNSFLTLFFPHVTEVFFWYSFFLVFFSRM